MRISDWSSDVCSSDLLAQKYIGLLHQQATAVAGLAIGRDRATMRHACQRGDGGLHELVRRLIVHVHDQAEATAVFFEFRPDKTVTPVFQHSACPISRTSGAAQTQD